MEETIVKLAGLSELDLRNLKHAGVNNGIDLSVLNYDDIDTILESRCPSVVKKKMFLIASYISYNNTVTEETTIQDIQTYLHRKNNNCNDDDVRRTLPPPTQCPSEGANASKSSLQQPELWIFIGNHFANFDYLYKQGVAVDNKGENSIVNDSNRIHTGVPVRLRKSAGFLRCWGLQDTERIGDQTCMVVIQVPEEDGNNNGNDYHAEAHDMVGVLVPIFDKDGAPNWIVEPRFLREVKFRDNVDWLGWTSPPSTIDTIFVHALPKGFHNCDPPTCRKPILQTHIDTIVEAAILAYHGGNATIQDKENFAIEWLMSTHWWYEKEEDDDEKVIIYYVNDREEARRPWAVLPMANQIDRVLRRVCFVDNNSRDCVTSVITHRLHEGEYGVKHFDELSVELGGWTINEASISRKKKKKGLEICTPANGTAGSIPITPQIQCTNFLFGFGSIIQTKSRVKSDPDAADAAPCRISSDWGYIREWNFQASTAKICALGLRRRRADEAVGSTINGVLFPAPDDMTEFDKRENGYARVEIPIEYVDILSWHNLPTTTTGNIKVFAYVPYAPSTVQKYGKDPDTGLPLCSGSTIPPSLDVATEGPGVGLNPPSCEYPILQTYIDVVITGCLEHGEDFAKEFIQTTFLWSPYWLNERTISRRPWLHQKQYVKIDSLLKEVLGDTYFSCRKLVSEYAALHHYEFNTIDGRTKEEENLKKKNNE